MVNKIISRGKKLINSPQTSILSAAAIIMTMIVASRVLGLVRQRVLAHFFTPSELSLFFAAFRLPDLVFEVLVYGTFSSAFIPVFTKLLRKNGERPWEVASSVVFISLSIFIFISLGFGIFARELYSLVAPGFSADEIYRIASLARILFAAQGFFVVSYVLTGVLESLKRFLVPALAPLFYNLGIIISTIVFSPVLGLTAPAVGVVIGAAAHLLIQVPFAYKLGFRFKLRIKIDDDVKKIGKLAAPRVVELSFAQVGKTVELFFSSLISSASYTYLYFANSLQLLPVSLFGTSLAKAALPTLARLDEDPQEFKKTLMQTFYQVMFLVLPIATTLIVLRIPIVRLVYGTDIFDWTATVQTGMVLTAYCFGVPFQAAVALLARAFFALNDTRTPVIVSLSTMLISVISNFLLVSVFGLPTWALAASFSLAVSIQAILLLSLLYKRLKVSDFWKSLIPFYKSLVAAIVSGITMFAILKTFDRSVWVKRLSFLKVVDIDPSFGFQNFVLDTRYTINLLILTAIVAVIGLLVYVGLSWLLKSQELLTLIRIIKRKNLFLPRQEPEPISPPTSEVLE